MPLTPDPATTANFADLQFGPRTNGLSGIAAKHDFANGYAVSVIRGYGTYGEDEGQYELAVMRGGKIVYDTPVTDDVLGHLSEDAVSEAMAAVGALPTPADAVLA